MVRSKDLPIQMIEMATVDFVAGTDPNNNLIQQANCRFCVGLEPIRAH